MIQVNFHEIEEFELSESDLEIWISSISSRHNKSLEFLDITLCSDAYLLEMNKQYLEHDYFTDILSFDISEIQGKIMGELYISLDRVKENATDLDISWVDELHRVIAHGVLHLCGLDDQDEVSKAQMRQEEEIVLALRMF
jgi:probable rRNA maturation factor